MSDNAKLKELAEALKRAIEQAEHKPGEWAGTAQSMGGICCPGVPFQIGKPWAKEEPWASFSYKRDSWLAVAAVNALPRLLGLIAEIERLQGCEDVLRQLASHVGAGGYNAPEVDPETFARKIMDGINILNDPMAQLVIKKGEQIDQLRAEVAGLRTGYEAYEQVVQGLKAENEALRKDAAAPGWKVWGGDRCDHCCNGDRCDDKTHVERSKCRYCKGTGMAIWLSTTAAMSKAVQP